MYDSRCIADIICQHGFSADSTETYPQHAQSLDGTTGSSIPLYRSSEEEKRVTVIKAPHYPGIGPVDESGIPTAIRTVGDASTEHRLRGCVRPCGLIQRGLPSVPSGSRA